LWVKETQPVSKNKIIKMETGFDVDILIIRLLVTIAILINMFKFGYKFYVIRRNSNIPFVFLYFGAAYPHPLDPSSPNG